MRKLFTLSLLVKSLEKQKVILLNSNLGCCRPEQSISPPALGIQSIRRPCSECPLVSSSPGTCSRRCSGRATPAGCAPPSSTTTTCSPSACWWCCWPSCCTSCACGGSTRESRGSPRSWTCSGWRRGRPCWPDGRETLGERGARERGRWTETLLDWWVRDPG